MDFTEIYKAYKDKIYRLTFNYRNTREQREDLMQEIFINIFTSYDKFKQQSKLSTYIYAIARNTAIKQINRDKIESQKYQLLYTDILSKFDYNPHVKYENDENISFILSIINKLPESYKTPLFLFLIDGLSLKEISNILGISITAAKTRIRRAKLIVNKKYLSNIKGGIS